MVLAGQTSTAAPHAMTLTVTLECGCRITLVSEGEHHRPEAPRPCLRHVLFVGPLLSQLLTARVHVGFVQDDAPVITS